MQEANDEYEFEHVAGDEYEQVAEDEETWKTRFARATTKRWRARFATAQCCQSAAVPVKTGSFLDPTINSTHPYPQLTLLLKPCYPQRLKSTGKDASPFIQFSSR